MLQDVTGPAQWVKYGEMWQHKYGSVVDPTAPRHRAKKVMVSWLTTRPPHLGGPWGVGCCFCAAALAGLPSSSPDVSRSATPFGVSKGSCSSAADRHARGVASARLSTKWAQYQVRYATLQASRIRQHSETKLHRLAENM